MKRSLSAILVALVILTASSFSARAQDFKKQVIYQLITDRFFAGTPSDNNPPQSPGLYDGTETNWQLYWGGNFAGIQAKMSYLKGMGVTAIWISPPVDNINVSIPDSNNNPTAPYHGYSARDFQRTEEHFGDSSNSWAEFDALTAAAHQNGIKVIVDLAANHTNPNSAGEMGSLYNDGVYVTDYPNDTNGYYHHNPGISDFNDRYQLQYYTLEGLADLNQENSYIDSYLKSALTQLQNHGADAFRLDALAISLGAPFWFGTLNRLMVFVRL